MPFSEFEGTEYFYFEKLREAGLAHGVFTRRGGVSPAPWGTLNAGSLVGDEPERVAENLRRVCRALDRDPATLRLVRQVHGSDVYIAGGAANSGDGRSFTDRLRIVDLPEADALVTADPEVTLAMRFADCVPILLYDPVIRAAGIAHAGWRGTLVDIAGRTVSAMQRVFGTEPADLLAGIGPSICADHYEIGQEVAAQVAQAFGKEASRMIRVADGRTSFDLWTANRLLLESAGVGVVEIAGECTAEQPERWYSHRGEGGTTGRFAVAAGIAGG
jgi:YfiH family protein